MIMEKRGNVLQKQLANLAILIDADNASADIVEDLFKEVAKYGIASTKRIYGDWTNSRLTKWKNVLIPYAITPIQQFSYTTGKNATDMAMVIDAMDLLYSGVFSGFCIVSSDSDFTRLASRIRENGLTVYGFGQKKTPEAFRKACDKFIFTENLIVYEEEITIETLCADKNIPIDNQQKQPAVVAEKKQQNIIKGDTRLMNLIRDAIDTHSDDSGWASLGPIGSYINRVSSDFDVKTYGFSKLSEFIKFIDLFETKQVGTQLKICKKNN